MQIHKEIRLRSFIRHIFHIYIFENKAKYNNSFLKSAYFFREFITLFHEKFSLSLYIWQESKIYKLTSLRGKNWRWVRLRISNSDAGQRGKLTSKYKKMHFKYIEIMNLQYLLIHWRSVKSNNWHKWGEE